MRIAIGVATRTPKWDSITVAWLSRSRRSKVARKRAPAATAPATIGAFYETIADGITTVNPAINPNAFAVNSGEATPIKSVADALAAIARSRGLEPIYVTRRGFRDNLAQYVPTAPGNGPEEIDGALDRFARERHLPDRGRGILENCIISRNFPVD